MDIKNGEKRLVDKTKLAPAFTVLSLITLVKGQARYLEIEDYAAFCQDAVQRIGPCEVRWVQAQKAVRDFTIEYFADEQKGLKPHKLRKRGREFREHLRDLAPFISHLFPVAMNVVVRVEADGGSFSLHDVQPIVLRA